MWGQGEGPRVYDSMGGGKKGSGGGRIFLRMKGRRGQGGKEGGITSGPSEKPINKELMLKRQQKKERKGSQTAIYP